MIWSFSFHICFMQSYPSMNVLPMMEDASITVTTQWGHITAVVELAGGCQAIVEHVYVCNHCFINNLSM